jgi:hypothetical protein
MVDPLHNSMQPSQGQRDNFTPIDKHHHPSNSNFFTAQGAQNSSQVQVGVGGGQMPSSLPPIGSADSSQHQGMKRRPNSYTEVKRQEAMGAQAHASQHPTMNLRNEHQAHSGDSQRALNLPNSLMQANQLGMSGRSFGNSFGAPASNIQVENKS